MRKYIKNWEELDALEIKESATHILKVDVENCNAHLIAKNEKPYNRKLSYMRQVHHLNVYLSTHTFYGHYYNHNSKILRACGFDVQLANWDDTHGE